MAKEKAKKEEIQEIQETENMETEQTEESVEESTEPEKSREEELNEKIKELDDRYLRLYAEYDNYQKRTSKEKEARYADAVIDTVAELIPTLDNLERALAVTVDSEEAKKLLEGVEMVAKQFRDTLQKLEVTEIPAVGEEFDPNLHNAVMHVEDDAVTDNTIVEEFMKGYIYRNNRVVRHSMVKVAN